MPVTRTATLKKKAPAKVEELLPPARDTRSPQTIHRTAAFDVLSLRTKVMEAMPNLEHEDEITIATYTLAAAYLSLE